MNVHIERDGYIECGLSASTCPAFFELLDGEKTSIVQTHQKNTPGDGEIDDDLRYYTP